MRRVFSALAVAVVATTSAFLACTSSDDVSSNAATRPDSGGSLAADTGPIGDADLDDAASLAVPPGCNEFTLSAGLHSTQETDPETYAFQPDLLGTPVLDGSPDGRFTFYLDAADAVGTYTAKPYTSAFYAFGNGGVIRAGYVAEDASDGGGGDSERYVAVSGAITITEIVTPWQTKGRLSNVAFRSASAASDGTISIDTTGKCYWLREAAWNTERAGACVPFAANTCAAGQQCMPTNAIGNDGICAATGAKGEHDACTLAAPPKWDSDCGPGLRCAEFAELGDTGYSCHSVCDVRSSAPACPADAHCGGGYETCIPNAFLENADGGNVEGNEIDTAASVGATCAQNPKAIYCGMTSTPGTCWTNGGDATANCEAWQTAPSACPASTGYAAYKHGIDQSTLFCFH